MKIITAAVFYLVYWFICFLCTGTDKKNLAGLRSYPDEVQARVRREPQLAGSIPKAKSMPAILLSNLLLFTAVFSILGAALKNVLGLDGYWTAFWYFLAFGEGLGLFDLVVIDLIWSAYRHKDTAAHGVTPRAAVFYYSSVPSVS